MNDRCLPSGSTFNIDTQGDGGLQWDLFDRLVYFEDARLSVNFAYATPGRHLHKDSHAHYEQRPEAGSLRNRNEHARKQRELFSDD